MTSKRVGNDDMDDVDMFARWCIEKNYRLTALELHQELVLQNKNSGVLSDFVREVLDKDVAREASNQESGRDSSSSLINTKISPFSTNGGVLEMIKSREERIAILEHDLLCVRKDLKESRQRLGSLHEDAATAETTKQMTTPTMATEREEGNDSKANSGVSSEDKKMMTMTERGILNCIVKKYLFDAGYRLTSMTFAEEEQSQDLDRLEDYGIHIGNRADLLAVYRSRIRPMKSALEMEDEIFRLRSSTAALEDRASKSTLEVAEMRDRYAELSREYEALSSTQSKERREMAKLRLDIAKLEEENARMSRDLRERKARERVSAGNSDVRHESIDDVSSKDAQENQLFTLLCRQLPHVAAAMVISKRMALVPLLVRTISVLPRPTPTLVATLCSLVPRPDYDEQEEMSAVLCALAANLGPDRSGKELMEEIISSQSRHRFKERRVQAALLCRTLSMHCHVHTILRVITPALIRMARHSEEASVEVREESLESLGFVLRNVLERDAAIRFPRDLVRGIREVLIEALTDEEPSVSESAQMHILDPIVQIEDSESCLFSAKDGVVSALVDQVRHFTDILFGDEGVSGGDISAAAAKYPQHRFDSDDDDFRVPTTVPSAVVAGLDRSSIAIATAPMLAMKRTLRTFAILTPKMFHRLVHGSSVPATARAGLGLRSKCLDVDKTKHNDGDDDDGASERCDEERNVLEAVLSGTVDFLHMEETLRWPSLKCVCECIIPSLLKQLCRARFGTRDGKQIRGAYIDAIASLCKSHGSTFTKRVVRPLFLTTMGMEIENARPPIEPVAASFLRIMGISVDDGKDSKINGWPTNDLVMVDSEMRAASIGSSTTRDDVFECVAPMYVQCVLLTLPDSTVYINDFLGQLLLDTVLRRDGWNARQYPTVEKMFAELPIQRATETVKLLGVHAKHETAAVRVKVTDLLASMVAPNKSGIKFASVAVPFVLSLASDGDDEVREHSVKAVLGIVCGDTNISDEERKKLNEKLLTLSQDLSHSVVLNVLRALVRFNQQCDVTFRNVQMVTVVAGVCRRVVRIAKAEDPKVRESWTHSENAEVATALISTVQAVWQYLLPAGQKELTVPLSQFMRVGEREGLLDPVFMSMLEMIVPQIRRNRTDVRANAKKGSRGALAGVLQRMSSPGSPENISRALKSSGSRFEMRHDNEDGDGAYPPVSDDRPERNDFDADDCVEKVAAVSTKKEENTDLVDAGTEGN